MARIGLHIRNGAEHVLGAFEKYVVNPYDDVKEWSYDEFQRLSDYLWTMGETIEAQIEKLVGILEYGVLVVDSGQGSLSGNVNHMDFTDYEHGTGQALFIDLHHVLTFHDGDHIYRWIGPKEVTIGIGGNYVAKATDFAGMSTGDHQHLSNKDLPGQHPITAITSLVAALENKASVHHNHFAADTHFNSTESGLASDNVEGAINEMVHMCKSGICVPGHTPPGGGGDTKPRVTMPIPTPNPPVTGVVLVLTVTATDYDTLQWQVNKQDGKGFVDISGAAALVYHVVAAEVIPGWEYAVLASNTHYITIGNAYTIPIFIYDNSEDLIIDGGFDGSALAAPWEEAHDGLTTISLYNGKLLAEGVPLLNGHATRGTRVMYRDSAITPDPAKIYLVSLDYEVTWKASEVPAFVTASFDLDAVMDPAIFGRRIVVLITPVTDNIVKGQVSFLWQNHDQPVLRFDIMAYPSFLNLPAEILVETQLKLDNVHVRKLPTNPELIKDGDFLVPGTPSWALTAPWVISNRGLVCAAILPVGHETRAVQTGVFKTAGMHKIVVSCSWGPWGDGDFTVLYPGGSKTIRPTVGIPDSQAKAFLDVLIDVTGAGDLILVLSPPVTYRYRTKEFNVHVDFVSVYKIPLPPLAS